MSVLFPGILTPDVLRAVPGDARFSPCRDYRYTLGRTWNADAPGVVNFIMLNPSIADESLLDPTVYRCLKRAMGLGPGYGRLVVTNLFAFRSTQPEGLLRTADPVGPENDEAILGTAIASRLVVLAWGRVPAARLLPRVAAVRSMLRTHGIPTFCLGRTKHGEPRHPLMLADAIPIQEYPL